MDNKIIAAFDFDGTITIKDTLFDFLFFYFGKCKVVIGFIILSPMLILYKLGFIKNGTAKEMLFSFFFKKKSIEDFNMLCQEYKKRIKEICKESTLDRIKWHQQQSHTVIIVSASILNWIEPWAREMGVNHVICTEIETINKCITGNFSTSNCYGQEKVNRLLAMFPDKNDYTLYAYGDSQGDKELLKLADFPILITKKQ